VPIPALFTASGTSIATGWNRRSSNRRGVIMVVAEIMTEDPISVEDTTPIRQVIATLFEQDIRHLPVLEGAELIGIVSDRDLRGFLAPAMLELEKPEEVQRRLAGPISAVMNSDVVSVTPETDIQELIGVMLDQKVGAVPVVRPGTQQLVGIVSYVDVLRAAESLFET
jgi:CBS domain-containing protein